MSLTFICHLRGEKGGEGRNRIFCDWDFASFLGSRASIFGIFCYFFVTPPNRKLLITSDSSLRRRLISNLSLSHPLTTSWESKNLKYLQVAREWYVDNKRNMKKKIKRGLKCIFSYFVNLHLVMKMYFEY